MDNLMYLNNELDKSLTFIENIENKLIELLVPINIILKEYEGALSPVIPKNVAVISIKNIEKRLEILKEDAIISSKLEEADKLLIIKKIDNIIIELNLIKEEDKIKHSRRIIDLKIEIDKRKKFVEEKYIQLQKLDVDILKIKEQFLNNFIENTKNDELNEMYFNLLKQRNNIVSDSDLCDDIVILYDYDFYEKNRNLEINIVDNNKINNVNDLYKFIDVIIKNQINEMMKYQFLSKEKIATLTEKINLNIKGYVDNYIISNSDLSSEIEEFSIITKNLVKELLENNFEMKNILGTEYIPSKSSSSRVITIKNVIEDDISSFDNKYINKFETILELSQVDMKYFSKVRDFVVSMGPEFVPIFDELWAQEDRNRKKFLKNKQRQQKIKNELLSRVDY